MLTFGAVVELSSLTGPNGFQINGEAANDRSGRSVSAAGDINGDGIDDLIIGAPYAAPNVANSGASYVVFGSRAVFAPNLELSSLTGTNGFQINGEAGTDFSGCSVSAAGDINGDGIDDLIVGARYADPNGSNSGASYVVFGKNTGFAANVNLSGLTGTNGFKISGVAGGDYSGWSVSGAGDINGDGTDDLIVGARGADPNGSASGASYVIFGQGTGTLTPTLSAGNLTIADTVGVANNLTVSISGANLVITDATQAFASAPAGGTLSNSNKTLTIALASITAGLTFNGSGGDDLLTLDFSGGDFTALGALIYNGGGQTIGDALTLTGGTTTMVTHSFTNANDGSVTLAGALAGTITYAGLEPVTDNLDAVNRVFTFTGGAETITLTNGGTLDMRIDSTLGELVDFTNPTTSLTINANSGADVVDITSMDAGYAGSLTISSDGGDTATISAGLPTLSSIAVTAATINLNTVTTSGTQTYTGNVTLQSSTTLNTTNSAVSITGTINGTTANTESLTIGAGSGAITLGGAIGGGTTLSNLTTTSGSAAFALPAITLGGNLGVTTSGGAITDSGNLSVGGLATFSAGASAITLGGGGETTNFGSLRFVGGVVTIQEDSALVIGGASGSSATTLSLTASGAITQTQTITATGVSSFSAGANAITLSLANALTGAVTLSNSGANNVALVDTLALSIATSSVGSGTLALTGAGISQTGVITQAAGAGAVTLTAGTGAISLALGNNFTGAVTASSTGVGTGINLNDASGGLSIASVTTSNGAVTLSATGGALDVLIATAGTGGAINLTTTTSGNITLGNVTTSGTATLNAAGAIEENGADGGADLTAGTAGLTAASGIGAAGAIETALANLSGTSATGGIALTNAGALSVTGLSATASGNITLANTGSISTSGAVSAASGTITFTAASPLTVAANMTASGDITLTAGEISDSPTFADALTVNGGVTVRSTAGNVTLRAGDDVCLLAGSTVTAFAAVNIIAGFGDLDSYGNAKLLGTINTGAAFTLVAPGDIIVGLINAPGQAVTLTSGNGGAGGGIFDTNDAGEDIIADTLSLNAVLNVAAAGQGLPAATSIKLETDVNNLDSLVRVGGSGNTTIVNTGALTYDGAGNGGTSGNVTITATSPLTIAGSISSPGNITLTAGETNDPGVFADDLTLNGGVGISSTGGNITLRAGDGIITNGNTIGATGTVTLTAAFGDLDSQGEVTLTGDNFNTSSATLITARNDITHTSSLATNGSLTLTSAVGDIFHGGPSLAGTSTTFTATAGSVTLDDVVNSIVNAFNTVDITAGNGDIIWLSNSVNGTTVTLTAGGADGDIGALGAELDTSSTDLIFTGTGTGAVFINNGGNTNVQGSTGSGNITFVNNGNLTVAGNISTTGDVSLSSVANSIFWTAGTVSGDDLTLSSEFIGAPGASVKTSVNTLTTSTFGGDQDITEANGLNAISLDAAGPRYIALTLTAGSLLDTDGAADITVSDASFTLSGAGAAIGSGANNIQTTVDFLTTATNNGNQFITESNGLLGLDMDAGTGDLTLTLTTDDLTDGDGSTDITADDASITLLDLAAMIGALDPIQTAVNTLTSFTVGGTQYFEESNGLDAISLDAGLSSITLDVTAGDLSDADGLTDVTAFALSVTLDGVGASIGAGTPIHTSITSLATITSDGNQSFRESNGISILNLAAGTGTVDLTLVLGSLVDGDGTAAITAAIASIVTLGAGATIGDAIDDIRTSVDSLTTTTNNGDLFLTEDNGLTALNLAAGTGDIMLTLTAGGITDADPAADITGVDATITAPDGMGTLANRIRTNVSTLTTDTTDTDQFILEDSGLSAINLDAGVGSVNILLTAGAVSDLDPGTDAAAGGFTVTAPAGIGSALNPISTEISTLAASATTAGIFVDNSGPMDIASATTSAGDIVINNYGADDDLSVTVIGDLSISGTVSTPDDITITAHEIDDNLDVPPPYTNDLTIAGTGSVSGDTVMLLAGDDLIIDGTVTSAGFMTLYAGYNDQDMYGNVTITGTITPGGGLSLTSIGDILLGVISAPGVTVNLTSLAGSILDNNDNDYPAETPLLPAFVIDIIAATVNLSAFNSIGESTDTIEMSVNTLDTASAINNGIWLWNTQALAVNIVSSFGDDIELNSEGTMTVNGPISQNNGNGIRLFATGATADMSLLGSVNTNDAGGPNGGNITISAGNLVALNPASSITVIGSATVTLNAGWPNQPGAFDSNPAADLTISGLLDIGASDLELTAPDNVILSGGAADIIAGSLTVHADRDESDVATGGSFIQNHVDSTVQVGEVLIEAADVTLAGTIDAGSGDIDVYPSDVASDIFINDNTNNGGGNGFGLNLSLTDMLALHSNGGTISIGEPATTGTVFIGRLGTVGLGLIDANYTIYGGEIDFNGGLVLADNNTLTLDSDGAILGIGATSLDAVVGGPQGTLVISAQSDVTLYTRVTRLGIANVVGGDLSINNSDSAMEVVGAVDAENVLLQTGPSLLTVSAAITANAGMGNGDVTLIQDQLSLNAAVTGDGLLTIKGYRNDTTIGLGDAAAGTLSIRSAELGFLTDGFAQIDIGWADQEGEITIDTPAGSPVTFHDPVVIDGSLTSGSVVINDGVLVGDDDASFTILASQITFSGVTAGVQTAGGEIFIEGRQFLGTETTIESNGGNIDLYGTINGTEAFVVNAGAGDVYINGSRTPVPSGTSLGGENALSSIDVTGGQLTLRPNIRTTGAQTFTASTGILALGGRFTSLNPGGDITFNGALELALKIAITARDQDIIFNGTVDSTAAGNGGLTLDAGTGSIEFNGAVGSNEPLKDFRILNAGQLAISGGFEGTEFIVDLDELDLNGLPDSVVISGKIEIHTHSATTILEIGGTESLDPNTLSLSEDDIKAFADGADSMLMTRSGDQPVNVVGPVTFHDPTTIRQAGISQPINVDATITGDTADGGITLVSRATRLNADITASGGGNIDIQDAILETDITLDTSAGGGNVTLRSTLNASTGGENLNILTGTGSATINASNRFTSPVAVLPGTITITGDDARIDKNISMGALVIDGGGTTYLKGRIQTTGAGGQDYSDPIELIGNTEFRSHAALGAIHLGSTLDSDPSNLTKTFTLRINNTVAVIGSTVVMFDAGVGQTRELNSLRIKTGGDVVFGAGADAAVAILNLRAGNFEVQDVLSTSTQTYHGVGTFSGEISASKLTITNFGDLVRNDAWVVTGLATLTAKDFDITVAGLGNQFGELKLTAVNATIEVDGNTALKGARITGTLGVTTHAGVGAGDLGQTGRLSRINRFEANLAGSLDFSLDGTRIYEVGDIIAGGSIELLLHGARYVLLDGTITAGGNITLAANAYGGGGSFRTGGSGITINPVGRYIVYSYFAADTFDGTDLRSDLGGLVDEEVGIVHPALPASADNVLAYIRESH